MGSEMCIRDRFHPLLVIAVLILGPDLVLGRVLPDRILDLEGGVVVGVGDGDLLVVLQVDSLLDAPGLVGDGLTDHVHAP